MMKSLVGLGEYALMAVNRVDPRHYIQYRTHELEEDQIPESALP